MKFKKLRKQILLIKKDEKTMWISKSKSFFAGKKPPWSVWNENERFERVYENEWVNSIHIDVDNSDQEANCNMLMSSVKKK